MFQIQSACRSWCRRGGRSHRFDRTMARSIEMLEARSLLSTMPSVLTRLGSINRPGGTGAVLLQLERAQFKAPSGKILFDVEVAPADQSQFVPRSLQIIGPGGQPIASSAPVRSGSAVFRQMLVAPGQYTVRASGAAGSTGAFTVFVHLGGTSTATASSTRPISRRSGLRWVHRRVLLGTPPSSMAIGME
jgi:hypothetical protein